MTNTKLNNSEVRAEPAASQQHRLIKLGLDVHADTIVVVRLLDNAAPQPAQRFTWAKFRAWIKTQLALADTVHSCYEAGPFGYGLHRELVELGVQNVVVQPVCLDERHTGVNHDPSDAQELALRLDRYVAGNTHALATVRVPTPEQEQQRSESRQREPLRREVQRVAAQGRGRLLIHAFSRHLGQGPIMAPNPRGGEKLRFAPAQAQRFKERSASERVNSLLKERYGGRWVRVRGAAKVMCHVMFGLVALTATALCARLGEAHAAHRRRQAALKLAPKLGAAGGACLRESENKRMKAANLDFIG